MKELIDNIEEVIAENDLTTYHCSVHHLLQFADETEKVVKILKNLSH